MRIKNVLIITAVLMFFSGMFFSSLFGVDSWKFYVVCLLIVIFWGLGAKYGIDESSKYKGQKKK